MLMYNPCDYCICKTCAIAEVNGGAEGCGNCSSCKSRNYAERTNSCSDYYNPTRRENNVESN